MKLSYKTTLSLAAAMGTLALAAGYANAAVVSVSNVYAFNTGNLEGVTDRDGLTATGGGAIDLNDPANWVNTGNGWSEESFAVPSGATTNGKLGWYAFKFDSSTALENLYVIAGNYQGNGQLTLKDFNVYYAVTPTVALSSGGDYNFQGGGWTQLGGLRTVGVAENLEIDASGVTAQYIGIEIMTQLDGSTRDDIGIEEFAATAAVPEPTTAALLGLGGLALILRRRK